ncbi:glycosyltransferase [Castellaniella sp.]|uniref:glycosyltransferase n=1 Tax=Castellaniella sp. TaxID=1955812 RepID=UPI002AFF4706|nr:glycosyltransferase [Castellaniella sp.]
MEIIHDMGFQGDYYVSHYWSSSNTFAWNSELALRFSLMLDRLQPHAVVFDGTWPFQGLLHACRQVARHPALVWSSRGLIKPGTKATAVDSAVFDLIIRPGELGATRQLEDLPAGGRHLTVPPVCLLTPDEPLPRAAARAALGLPLQGRLALFSLGPGNLKDVSGIGHGLLRHFQAAGFQVAWTRAPISVRDIPLPDSVLPISVYPLARYLRAFDCLVAAAGYNTCCEVVQSGIPTLFVPNTQLVDDQQQRALQVAEMACALVSPCETDHQRQAAVQALLKRMGQATAWQPPAVPMDGADLAADAILAVAQSQEISHG